MLKKLTEEQQNAIIETAIEEFGSMGPERASIRTIANNAGVSVGVIYKYYNGKDDLFEACLRRSLDYLNDMIDEAAEGMMTLEDIAGNMITASQKAAREHPSYFRMYNTITSSTGEMAVKYVVEIEKMTAGMYTKYIEEAQKKGLIRNDVEPGVIAFHFDNMLMMLHFSYCSGYYGERMRLYGIEYGDDKRDSIIKESLIKIFFEGIGERSL